MISSVALQLPAARGGSSIRMGIAFKDRISELNLHRNLLAPSEKTQPRHYQPLNLLPAGGTVSMLSRSPAFLIPYQQLARNSCSVCATKGGVRTSTTICGVLLLDPSLHSPLELVKSVVTFLVHGDGITRMRPARNLGS
jgi:hypothetical protein